MPPTDGATDDSGASPVCKSATVRLANARSKMRKARQTRRALPDTASRAKEKNAARRLRKSARRVKQARGSARGVRDGLTADRTPVSAYGLIAAAIAASH